MGVRGSRRDGLLMAVTIGSAGAGATSSSATSLSWSHTVAADDNLVVVVVATVDGTATISATYAGSAMTLRGRGYRLAVFTAPNSTSGAQTVTASSTGTANWISANSLTLKSAFYGSIVVNPASTSSNDGGTHTATATAASGGMLVFCVGQAYGSAEPTFTNATSRFWTGTGNTSAGAATTAGTGSAITMSCTTGQWGSAAALVLTDTDTPIAVGSFFSMF